MPSFGAIVYERLYDGVLKYDFHVVPGADWNQIRIAYDGIDSLCIDDNGDLRISTAFGTPTDSAPLVWQEDVDSTPSPGACGGYLQLLDLATCSTSNVVRIE